MSVCVRGCNAVVPCVVCSRAISEAREAREAYASAQEALAELLSSPWLIEAGGGSRERFDRVYEALGALWYDANRRSGKEG